MARVKLRCIIGCPGLNTSYREKGILLILLLINLLHCGISLVYFLFMTLVYQYHNLLI